MPADTITLPLADVRALVALAWEQTRHIEATDKSATGSIYGIEYADKTIAKVAVQIPPAYAERCNHGTLIDHCPDCAPDWNQVEANEKAQADRRPGFSSVLPPKP